MKFAIENGLKELKWDKMKTKIIDKDVKKRLLMMEDLILNLHSRTSEVFKYCQTMCEDFVYILPTLSEKDQHFGAYQKNLLFLEGIYQFVDFVTSSRVNDLASQGNLKEELSLCKRELANALKKLDAAVLETDSVKKLCKDYLKQTQLVHEKCNLKTLHYKEIMRENKQLLTKNKNLDIELKKCELKIADLMQRYESNKQYIEKMVKDLKVSKAAVREKTIEINILEKINVEQSMEDEIVKDKLFNIENQIQSFKVHDQELYNHVLICENQSNCRYKRSDLPFKYKAAKNLIKEKMAETSNQKNEILILNQKIVDLEKSCRCIQNQVNDFDGIIEENRRLWDGYMDLQVDQISKEKDIEILENNRQIIQEELHKVKCERNYLEDEREVNQIKIEKYLKIIEELKEKRSELEEELKNSNQNDTESSELLHLRSFLDEQKEILQDKELKFISLENEYLHAQDLLEEYKKSFDNFEEQLDNKTLEHEERISILTEELEKLKNENSILNDPLVNIIVDISIKMEELEECIDGMINILDYQTVNDDTDLSNGNFDNKYSEFNKNNYDTNDNNSKNHFYEDLKYKISDLKLQCTNSIETTVQNVDNKLETYKMILFNEDDTIKSETFPSKTYENIKIQLSLVNT